MDRSYIQYIYFIDTHTHTLTLTHTHTHTHTHIISVAKYAFIAPEAEVTFQEIE